jgi:hypothetical protein
MKDSLTFISAVIAMVAVGGISGTWHGIVYGRASDRMYFLIFAVFTILGVMAFLDGPSWAWPLVAACGVGFMAGTILAIPSDR